MADALSLARTRPRVSGAWVLLVVLTAGVTVSLGLPTIGHGWAQGWPWWVVGPVAPVGFGAPAVLLLRRDRHSTMGRLLGLVAVLTAVSQAAEAWAWFALVGRPGALPGAGLALWLAWAAWLPAYLMLPTVLLLLCPDGALAGPRWRWAVGLCVVAVATVSVAGATAPYRTGPGADTTIPQQPADLHNPLMSPSLQHWLRWSWLLLVAAVAVSVASLVLRWRRSNGIERQQLRLVTAGAVVTVALMAVALATPPPWYLLVVAVALVPFPVGLGLAAYRHSLWDLDLVVRRSLVYGAMTVAVVAVYLVVVVGLGSVVGAGTGAPLLAVAMVGLGAAPLRTRLQRLVDRRVYGERGDPSAAVQRLAARSRSAAAQSGAVEELDGLARDVAEALLLPGARVVTALGRSGSYGEPVEPVTRVPLLHHGQVVGELRVAARDAGHPLDRRDEQAVRRMADYVAVVVHARRLTDELELSRERAAVAREEERRRLRRDLHDGLGPELAAIALQLETLRDLADGPDTPAGALADTLRAHVRTALGEVRRIVDGLRPPMLDDLGLVAALQEQVERFTGPSFRVTLDIDDDLPPLPAAVETAVLRIVAEAVTNAHRHGAAHTCTVTLAASAGHLLLDVIDDGRGIGPGAAENPGVGLGSMNGRAAELGGRCHVEPAVGGGTAVRARIPFVRPDVPVR